MKLNIFVIALLAFASQANAQRYFGLNQSNYNGTQGMLYNPAKLSTSRQIFSFNLFTINAFANNNVYKINSDSVKKGIFSYKNINGTSPANIVAPYVETILPSASFTIGNKLGFGISTRVRLFNQMHNANQALISSFNGVSNGTITAINDNIGFNLNIHALTDIGISGGYKLFDNDKIAASVGASLRRYRGVGYVNFNNKGMVGKYIDNSSNPTPTPDYLQVNNIDVDINTSAYDYQKIVDQFTTPQDALKVLFGKNAAGKGIGFDIGGEIVIKNNKNKNYTKAYKPYTVKLGASLLDIGNLNYSNVKQAIIRTNAAGTPVVLDVDSLNEYSNDVQKIREYAGRRGLKIDSLTRNVKAGLPTTLNLYADVSITKKIFVSVAALINMQKTNSNAPFYYSQFTVIPRLETKVIDIAIPLTYNLMSKDIKYGAAIRLGPLNIGSDDMSLLLKNAKGGNVYFGLRFGINKKKKSNDPIVGPGTQAVNSISKTDSVLISKKIIDSVIITKYQIDTVSKIIETNKDSDGDGIIDDKDKCPTVIGALQNEGCPELKIIDTDNDGIEDNKDECPAAFGLKELNGCPDADGDGIADDDDKCPTLKGTFENKGCPVIKEEVKKRIDFAAKAIQFETGKAVLKPISLIALNEVVKILNDYTDYDLQINGHTDNVGGDAANKLLSQNRANAVKNYFIQKGINESRLQATGYGMQQPKVLNTTTLNKAINRRVEMKLMLH